MNAQTDIKGNRFTGFHMAMCMVLFFGVIIAVNLTMAVIASKSWTGLVVKNSYVASQQYNTELARAEKQHDLGWQSKLKYQAGRLTFSILDETGSTVFADSVVIKIGRPAFEQEDRIIVLSSGHSGLFSTEQILKPGAWSLQIEASVNGDVYRRDARIVVGSDGVGDIE